MHGVIEVCDDAGNPTNEEVVFGYLDGRPFRIVSGQIKFEARAPIGVDIPLSGAQVVFTRRGPTGVERWGYATEYARLLRNNTPCFRVVRISRVFGETIRTDVPWEGMSVEELAAKYPVTCDSGRLLDPLQSQDSGAGVEVSYFIQELIGAEGWWATIRDPRPLPIVT